MTTVWLLLLVCSGIAQAFPNSAGSCDGAGGQHIDDHLGTRLIERVDHGTTFVVANHVSLSKDHVNTVFLHREGNVDFRVTSDRRFKGFLFVTKLVPDPKEDENPAFSLTPKENAQSNPLCFGETMEGLTHTSNAEKTSFSGTLQLTDTATFTLQLTMVEYNNATGSVYSEESYGLIVLAQTLPQNQPQPAPIPEFDEDVCLLCPRGHEIDDSFSSKLRWQGFERRSCQDIPELAKEDCHGAQALLREHCHCKAVQTKCELYCPLMEHPEKHVQIGAHSFACEDLRDGDMTDVLGHRSCSVSQALIGALCGCAYNQSLAVSTLWIRFSSTIVLLLSSWMLLLV